MAVKPVNIKRQKSVNAFIHAFFITKNVKTSKKTLLKTPHKPKNEKGVFTSVNLLNKGLKFI